MKFGSFLKLVEIQTKLASVIPFLLGTTYAIYRFQKFNAWNFIILFISLISIDMTTTAVNNFLDFKKANKRHGYNYETHNAIVKDNLEERRVLGVILTLLSIAVVAGFILFLRTDIIVLLLGGLSFLVGICYSFGPLPISRTPFGELFSGFFMGFVISFLSIYVHVQDMGLISFTFQGQIVNISIKFIELLYIFIFSVPAICGIANIMLANNICDIEDDKANNRYTLPIYIGKKNALRVFAGLYIIAYLACIALVALGVMPLPYLLLLITFIPVWKHIKIFFAKQTKKDTFILSVKNFMLSCGAQLLVLAGIVLFKYIFLNFIFQWYR